MTKLLYSSDNILGRPNSNALAAVSTEVVWTADTAPTAPYLGSSINFSILASKSGFLVSLASNSSCILRLYSSASSRALDLRAYDSLVPEGEIVEGLIAEVELSGAPNSQLSTLLHYIIDDSSSTLFCRAFYALEKTTPSPLSITLTLIKFEDQSINRRWFATTNIFRIFNNLNIIVPSTQSFTVEGLYGLAVDTNALVLTAKINGINIGGLTSIQVNNVPKDVIATSNNMVFAGDTLTYELTQTNENTGFRFSTKVLLL